MRVAVLLAGMSGCVLSSGPLADAGESADGAPPADAAIDSAPPPPLLAVGAASVTTEWNLVSLARSFSSPVVIATPGYDAASPPLVTRIRNVTGDSFELRVDRLDGSAGAVEPVTAYYIVVEEGIYDAATHGVTMEAVTFASQVTDGTSSFSGESRGYANSYTSPVVLGQVMTANDAASVFWARGALATDPPAPAALFAGKHVGADPVTTRADETVGYLVIEAGSSRLDGISLVAGVTGDIVQGIDNMPPYSQAVEGLEEAPAGAVLSAAGIDGGDGFWPLLFGAEPVSAGALQLAADEDQLADAERSHTTEQVAYLVFAGAP